jgi:hypothetical protein
VSQELDQARLKKALSELAQHEKDELVRDLQCWGRAILYALDSVRSGLTTNLDGKKQPTMLGRLVLEAARKGGDIDTGAPAFLTVAEKRVEQRIGEFLESEHAHRHDDRQTNHEQVKAAVARELREDQCLGENEPQEPAAPTCPVCDAAVDPSEEADEQGRHPECAEQFP